MGPDLAWQPSLLDGGDPRLDVSYDGLRRITLDERSWVDYCPGWLAGSDTVFDSLAAQASWQQRTVTMWDKQVLEPRLTAGWSTSAEHVPPLLAEMCASRSEGHYRRESLCRVRTTNDQLPSRIETPRRDRRHLRLQVDALD